MALTLVMLIYSTRIWNKHILVWLNWNVQSSSSGLPIQDSCHTFISSLQFSLPSPICIMLSAVLSWLLERFCPLRYHSSAGGSAMYLGWIQLTPALSELRCMCTVDTVVAVLMTKVDSYCILHASEHKCLLWYTVCVCVYIVSGVQKCTMSTRAQFKTVLCPNIRISGRPLWTLYSGHQLFPVQRIVICSTHWT